MCQFVPVNKYYREARKKKVRLKFQQDIVSTLIIGIRKPEEKPSLREISRGEHFLPSTAGGETRIYTHTHTHTHTRTHARARASGNSSQTRRVFVIRFRERLSRRHGGFRGGLIRFRSNWKRKRVPDGITFLPLSRPRAIRIRKHTGQPKGAKREFTGSRINSIANAPR